MWPPHEQGCPPEISQVPGPPRRGARLALREPEPELQRALHGPETWGLGSLQVGSRQDRRWEVRPSGLLGPGAQARAEATSLSLLASPGHPESLPGPPAWGLANPQE